MRVATSCDTIVRVCGLSARDTVETCTPARCAICLIPDGDLLMPAKIRLWRATPQVTRITPGIGKWVQHIAGGSVGEAQTFANHRNECAPVMPRKDLISCWPGLHGPRTRQRSILLEGEAQARAARREYSHRGPAHS